MNTPMKLIGNLLWLLFGGLLTALAWAITGLLWCITVLGIPVGLQCFKFAGLCLWPMGHDVSMGGGVMSILVNILWLIFGGLELALGHAVMGLILCITIVGIPFGRQHFKIAKLALMPFGASIE